MHAAALLGLLEFFCWLLTCFRYCWTDRFGWYLQSFWRLSKFTKRGILMLFWTHGLLPPQAVHRAYIWAYRVQADSSGRTRTQHRQDVMIDQCAMEYDRWLTENHRLAERLHFSVESWPQLVWFGALKCTHFRVSTCSKASLALLPLPLPLPPFNRPLRIISYITD